MKETIAFTLDSSIFILGQWSAKSDVYLPEVEGCKTIHWGARRTFRTSTYLQSKKTYNSKNKNKNKNKK